MPLIAHGIAFLRAILHVARTRAGICSIKILGHFHEKRAGGHHFEASAIIENRDKRVGEVAVALMHKEY